MKKISVYSLLLSAVFFTGCLFNKNYNVVSEKKIPVKEIGNIYSDGVFVSERLSSEEAVRNIEGLCYLLETSYSGYDAALENGFDIEVFKFQLFTYVQDLEYVNTNEFCDYIYNLLKPYIKDIHFCIQGFDGKTFRPTQHENILFSDLFVEETDEGWIIVKCNDSKLLNKTIVVGKENLFCYPVEKDNVYRIGKFSREKFLESEFEIDGKNVNIQFNLFNELEPEYNVMEEEFETEDSAYIRVTSFSLPDLNSELRKKADSDMLNYMLAGKKYHNKKNVILDLRGNPGGDDRYSQTFLYNLLRNTGNTSSTAGSSFAKRLYPSDAYSLMMYAPSSAKFWIDYCSQFEAEKSVYEDYSSKYKTVTKKEIQMIVKSNGSGEELKNQFEGKLYILTDQNIASSGESSIQYAQYLFGKSDQVFIVGTNTMGCISYGNLCYYKLSENGLILYCAMADMRPMLTNDTSFAGEGYGFIPNYWATCEDAKDVIVRLTDDEEIAEYIK